MSIIEQDPTTTDPIRNESIIGRADLDDLEAILAVSNTDPDEVEHSVKDNADALFTWDYSLARPQLRKLYEKGKVGQWNATTDLPWDTEVDLEKVVSGDQVAIAAGLDPNHYDGTVSVIFAVQSSAPCSPWRNCDSVHLRFWMPKSTHSLSPHFSSTVPS